MSSLQKCATPQYISVLINIEDINASQPDQKYGYAIECVFAACCEVSRWRTGGGARRQEATFQSVCSAISTPTPPLIIHKYKNTKYKNKCRNIKIYKLKRTLLTKKKMWSVNVEVKVFLHLGDCSYKEFMPIK